MSVFICGYTTINQLAYAVVNDFSPRGGWAKDHVLDAVIDYKLRESHESQLASALFQLNAQSSNARYPNHPQQDLEYIGFRKQIAPLTLGGLIKKLDCYLYQIEGEKLENSNLCVALKGYREAKIAALLDTLPDYKNEDWG